MKISACNVKKLCLICLFLLATSTLVSSYASAIALGIHAVSKQGKQIYLYEDYHALVIGVSNYKWWPKLPYARNDAKQVAERLKKMGYKVKLLLDPTSRQLKAALNDMVYAMGMAKDRAILLYYAGHGETETLADNTKMGYLIPKDCPLLKQDPSSFTSHAVSMRDMESVSLKIRSKHVLMLFDSCFSGSLFGLVRTVPEDITEKSSLPVRQYITAGREDEQVPDKSIFKRSFLVGLEGDADPTADGYITGSELGMYLSNKVVNYTHGRQHPQYGKINNPNLDRGDYIFVPPKKPNKEQLKGKDWKAEKKSSSTKIPSTKRTKEEVNLEMMFWDSIKDSDDIRYFQEYLNRFPNGTFTGLARLKIESLSQKDTKQTEDTEIIEEHPQANLIPLSSEDLKPDSKIKLAIFPWYVKTNYILINRMNENSMINVVRKVLKESDEFIAIYSYYEFGSDLKTKSIPDDKINDLWIKKGAFANNQPNTDLMSELGTQLKVDAILIYKVIDHRIWIYLIDVKSKQKYVKEDWFYYLTWSDEMKNFSKQFLAEIAEKRYRK